jgi:hypothetical protein
VVWSVTISPFKILKRVDFPFPFKPRSPIRSPTDTVNWAFLKMVFKPKFSEIFFKLHNILMAEIIRDYFIKTSLVKTSMRLLAGISKSLNRVKPFFSMALFTSSKDLIPLSGSCTFNIRSNSALLSDVKFPP